MSEYEEDYESAMEPTNSFNWEPPLFNRERDVVPYIVVNLAVSGKDIYCWRCHKSLNVDEFYYCFDCAQEYHGSYWGA